MKKLRYFSDEHKAANWQRTLAPDRGRQGRSSVARPGRGEQTCTQGEHIYMCI